MIYLYKAKLSSSHLPLKVKVVAKNISYKTDVSCDIGHNCQGVIQTKMEVGIQFWAANLGLSPKYD